VALGGQGAPLVPAFHRYAFNAPTEVRAVVNIGCIANVTLLNPGAPLIAFNTGPGNTLLDAWCAEHTGSVFDACGHFAASGRVMKLCSRSCSPTTISADSHRRAPASTTSM
jgi:anhydro-N-acetylmuramic acid kinase